MLTPLDIQNAAFHRAFRGYSEKEVDDFLDRVVLEYEHIYRENLELKERLAAVEAGKVERRTAPAPREEPVLTQETLFVDTRREAARSAAEADAESLRQRRELEADEQARLGKALADEKARLEKALADEKARLEEAKRQYRLFSMQFRAMLTSYYRMLGDSEAASGVDVAREFEGLYKEAAAAGLE